MGQGQDKIARSLVELEPTAIVELFLVYFNYKDDPNSFFAFHGGSVFQNPIIWQGTEYLPLPVETEGFEVNANGRIARPKIKISNKDYIITDLLKGFEDLQFSRLVRKRTFVKYLDNANFADGNPWGQSDSSAELSNDTFVLSQKTAENKLYVEFELTSQLDIDGWDLNNRKIFSTYCGFTYRGDGCGYDGLPLTDNQNNTLSPNARSIGALQNGDPNESFEWLNYFYYRKGDIVVVEDKSYPLNYFITEVPNNILPNDNGNYLKTYYVAKADHLSSLSNSPMSVNRDTNWTKDECIKTLNACKKRFNSESYTKYYTGELKYYDNYVDFTTKIPNENTGINLQLVNTTQLNDFFNTGFYKDDFTIAMWISMPRKPARTNYPYSLFTNANPATQAGTEGANALNYYLWNGSDGNLSLGQLVRIRKSDGTLRMNGTSPSHWPSAGLITADNSYQLLLFECKNPTKAGGYVELSINNNPPGGRLTLGAGEQFTFARSDFSSFATGLFRINSNNIWGAGYNQSPRVTPANIHGLAIWSRNLTNAEKLWLGRADTEPSSTREIQEYRTPRLRSEITNQYLSLNNNLELWMSNDRVEYSSSNKRLIWTADRINAGQTTYDLYLQTTGLNNDLHNQLETIFKYEYSYTKTPKNWLPFGGFPATYKYSYGEI
jgi:lambda family phage minor tail protein L